MTNAAAPKVTAESAGQFLIRAISIAGVSVCLGLFMVSAALAQHGSHGGGSHGAGGSHGGGGSHGASGHASGSHGGGGNSGGGHQSGSSHAMPAPAHVSVSMEAEGNHGAAVSAAPRAIAGGNSSAAMTRSAGMARTAFASSGAAETSPSERNTHIVFVSGAGRTQNGALENLTASPEPLAARNRLWMSPSAFAGMPQQQERQRPAPPPPAPAAPVRPAPMPAPPVMSPPLVSPPIMARPMPGPVVVTPPVIAPPVMAGPIARKPITLPGAPRARMPVTPKFGIAGPLPVPPRLRAIVPEPGVNNNSHASVSAMAMPVPPLFCNSGFPNCGFGFDGDFDFDDGFFPSPFFFAFGGPFGFGGPCLFDGVFLNCFGGGWNGPFGWSWGTPWGYNPALTGSLYPIGGYSSPTPAEMNQASVNSIGPTTFAPSQPEQLILAPSGELAQAVAYLVTKDGIEFGVTKYWLEDNRIFYITTYNIQSSIPIEQLDLQATVDINYKRGITFTLTPKQEEQKSDQPRLQPPSTQPHL